MSYKDIRYSSKYILSGFLSIYILFGTIEVARGEIYLPEPKFQERQRIKANEDSDLGRPPTRSSGVGRSSILADKTCPNSVVALVPGDGDIQLYEDEECLDDSQLNYSTSASLAYTAQSRPSLWIYIPEEYAEADKIAEVVLIDNLRKIASWEIQLPTMEGIMCLQLPYELEADNVYQWRFTVQINEHSPAENPRIGGLIQYTQQAQTYWHDDLTRLGTQIQNNSEATTDIISQWEQLLASQGLEEIASVPIINPCIEISDVAE